MGFCILNRVSNGLPAGGTANQVLTKNSAVDGDAKWVTPSYVPTGGAVNQVLTKNSATDGDTKWVTPSYCYVDDQGVYEGSTPINADLLNGHDGNYYKDADLLEGHDTEYFVNELGCIEIFIDEFSTLPQTVSNNLITSDSVVINSILSNHAAQTSDWTVTSTTGALEVSGTISGTTSLTMYLVNKQH